MQNKQVAWESANCTVNAAKILCSVYDSRNEIEKLRAHTMSSQQRDCLCATKGLNKYKEMGRKKFHQQFLTMFLKEITCHGAIAPLTGCKLKSFYILKGQLSNNFYCLQSDLPYRPAELP